MYVREAVPTPRFCPGGHGGDQAGSSTALGSFTTCCHAWGQRHHSASSDPAPLPQAHSWGGDPVHPTGAAPALGSRGEHPAGTRPLHSAAAKADPSCKTAPPTRLKATPNTCTSMCCWGSLRPTPKPPRLALVLFCHSLNYNPVALSEAAISISKVPSFVQALLG